MSIPTIDGNSLDAWAGILVYGPNKSLLFEQGGDDGYGVLFGGLKTGPQTITTKYRAANQDDAEAQLTVFRNLVMSTVTVVDQFGDEWDNVIVMGVLCTLAVDPLGWILSTTWSLLPESI
jgi:hypothetical protein